MAQSPQLNDSQLNLLAKIAANTGDTQPKHGDGQHNLLFKIAQNTYASAINGANIDISDVGGLQPALDGKVESVDPNYVLVKPTDNLAEKYSQIKNYTPSTPSPLLSGLLAFYNLGNLIDSSGNNRILTNNGNVIFQNGIIGGAANFNGGNYLLSNVSGDTSLTKISFSSWIFPTRDDQDLVILCQNFDDSSPWFLHPFDGQMQLTGGGGETFTFGYEDENNNSFVPINQWSHVVTTYDDTTKTWKSYVNGIKTAEITDIDWPSISNFTGVSVGWHPGDIKFEGNIDALGIWSRVLTDSEVSALYNAGHGIEHPFFRSATNRGTMFVVPGTYSLSSELTINSEYVDIVGLGAQFQSPAVIVTNNTLNVTANDVRVSGVSVGTQQFKTGNNKPLQVFENCRGTGLFSFSGGAGGSGGTFVNCVAGEGGFSGGGFADGKYTNCISGPVSFGAGVEASGVFTNCIGDELSFGSDGGILTGKLFSCRLSFPGDSYQTPSGSGLIRFCLDGDNNIVNADAP